MNAKISFAIVLGMAGPAAAQSEFRGLGFYDDMRHISYAFDVSDDGRYVVGMAAADLGNYTAFVWDAETGKKTELVQRSAAYESTAAYSISGTGGIVGLAQGPGEPDPKIAFTWQSGTFDMVGDIAGGPESALFLAMSGDGTAGTGVGDLDVWPAGQAFRWTRSGGIEALGCLPGDIFSVGMCMSADGKAIFGISGNRTTSQAMKWTESGGMVGLGDLPGGAYMSEAYGCSDDGRVVVGESFGESGYEAFKVSGEGLMEGLKDFAGMTDHSRAYATNHDGSMIVGWGDYDVTTGLSDAAVWTDSGIRRLKDVIEHDYGVNIGSWRLLEARSISPDGRFLCGLGINPEGEREGWYFRADAKTCRADCNTDGKLNINDFICMQAKWRARDPYGDYDGSGTYTVNDFIRFQADFVKGCG